MGWIIWRLTRVCVCVSATMWRNNISIEISSIILIEIQTKVLVAYEIFVVIDVIDVIVAVVSIQWFVKILTKIHWIFHDWFRFVSSNMIIQLQNCVWNWKKPKPFWCIKFSIYYFDMFSYKSFCDGFRWFYIILFGDEFLYIYLFICVCVRVCVCVYAFKCMSVYLCKHTSASVCVNFRVALDV